MKQVVCTCFNLFIGKIDYDTQTVLWSSWRWNGDREMYTIIISCFLFPTQLYKITLKTMSLLNTWTWGTKYNFMYRFPMTGKSLSLFHFLSVHEISGSIRLITQMKSRKQPFRCWLLLCNKTSCVSAGYIVVVCQSWVWEFQTLCLWA